MYKANKSCIDCGLPIRVHGHEPERCYECKNFIYGKIRFAIGVGNLMQNSNQMNLASLFAIIVWRILPMHSMSIFSKNILEETLMLLRGGNSLRVFLAFVVALSIISCSANISSESQKTDVQQGTVEWVDADLIQSGPIRQESLTEEQLRRIHKVYDVFAEVDGQPLEVWIDNFKRDLDPDKELDIWERMAAAYSQYCEDRALSIEAKREVYGIVLLRSMASENDVLRHIELKILSTSDAKEIMKGF